MQDVRTKQLKVASFRGFIFLCPEESVPSVGRKIVKHDYPNSGKRFAQDLGPLPSDFDVTAVITGDNFLQKAINFERILNKKGIGQLVLPHQGTLDVVALPFEKNYSQKSVGVVTFKLKFTISNTNEVPAQAAPSKEDVYQAGDEVRLSAQKIMEEKYEIPTDRKNVFTAANDYRRAIVNSVQDYSAKIIVANSKLQKIVRDVQTDLTTLIRDPIQLAEKLILGNIALKDGLFATFSVLFSDITSLSGGSKPSASDATVLAKFGEDFKDNGTSQSPSGLPLWPTNTGQRIQRNINRVLMLEGVRINSLTLGFEVAANFDYETSDEIASVVGVLENVYNDLFLTGDTNSIYANDNEFKLLMDDMKSQCYDVLDAKAQQVYSVGLFTARGRQSVMNMAYKLYAEGLQTPENLEEVAERLVQLNPSQNPIEFSGDIQIFEVA